MRRQGLLLSAKNSHIVIGGFRSKGTFAAKEPVMIKPVSFAFLAVFGVAALSGSANAGFYRHNGGEPYALAYCNFYKTRAMYAGRKARARVHYRKNKRRAIAMWRKYNACLKDNFWPYTYPIPKY